MRAALPWVLLMLLMASHAHAQRLTPASYDSDLKTVRALLQQPESRMDLGVIKLAVDPMIDPSIDVAATAKQIDQLAEGADDERGAAGGRDPHATRQAARGSLRTAGSSK